MNRVFLLSLLLGASRIHAASTEASAGVFQKAYAVLEQHCLKCHSHAAEKSKGGLLLDSRAALLAGGDTGPALVEGKPEDSMLLKAIGHTDPDLKMPPKGGKLDESSVLILTEWVKAGAPWPQEHNADPPKATAGGKTRRGQGQITDGDRQWWAFQPVRPITPPIPRDPGAALANDIDRFLIARLEQEQITPAPPAGRAALIRRVTFDLTGLPPSPEDVAGFVSDPAGDAYARLVDRLIASPQYGERMARQWLDLVRYADGDGYRADDYRPDAWRFRDYVIRSFNNDKSYPRFVQEQLAGDELFPEEPDAIIATGYLRHGIYEWNARDARGQWDTILNDLTDTTGDVFMGLGMQCARCHDHKFDPILQRDYFRLRAFFAPVQPGDRVAATRTEVAVHAEKLKIWETKNAPLLTELAALEKPYLDSAERGAVARFPDDIQAMLRKPVPQRAPLEAQLAALAWRQVIYDQERVDRNFKGGDKERILTLRRQLAALSNDKPAPLPVAFAAADVGPAAPPVFIPKKQNIGEIEPGFLTLLAPAPATVTTLPHSTGRRSALATWLTAPDNPLATRVIVNRVWQQHFGRGLAANASDFGMLGEKPSHPDLLDWLAGWFVQEGSSLKKLHRLIVGSAAYQRASTHPAPQTGQLKDPENRLLWKWQPQRLDAEQIRDAMLAVSGLLKPAAGGPGLPPDNPLRTIFTRFMRNTRDPLADVFDAPQWFSSAASRDTTTTPVQSLLLANSASLRASSRVFAELLEAARPGNAAGQIDLAWQRAYGRSPASNELAGAQAFLKKQASLADPARLGSGQASFIPGKVPYRDGQAAMLEPDSGQSILSVKESASLPLGGAFTVEAFFVPRSVSDSGDLRTIAAKWNGDKAQPGWTLGITGQKSRRRPLSVALQTVGTDREGRVTEQPIFSDLSIQMNKPYFLGAAFTPATEAGPGFVLFALKDLSNDDEPLLTARVEHQMTGAVINTLPVTIGSRSGSSPQAFHGLIDDVRLSNTALPAEKMLYSSESITDSTLGYWKFEARPDVFDDSSGNGRTIVRPADTNPSKPLTPSQAALADLCNALFNSSEFLYTE